MTRSDRAEPRSRLAARERAELVQAVTGSSIAFRISLRTGRMPLALATLVPAGLIWATAHGVRELYATEPARQLYAATMGASPTSMAFNGKPYDLTTIGGITVAEVGFLGFLLLPLVAVVLGVHFTRRQEDIGRVELVTAGQVGRMAPLIGGLGAAAIAGLITGLLSLAGLLSAGLSVAGSLMYATALTGFFLTFLGIGALASQLSQSARSALGLALACVGICFLLRAIIDGRGISAAWSNPMSWLSETRPYGESPNWWPTLTLLGTAALLVGVAGVLCERRDLNAGLLVPRRGPANARESLLGPLGMTLRLVLPIGFAWLLGASIWGFALGLLTDETRKMLDANPALAEVMGTAEDSRTAYLGIAVILVAVLSSCCGVQCLSRLAGEEVAGRLGLLLSGSWSRWRWWSTGIGTGMALAAATLLGGSVTVGLGARMATGSQGFLDSAVAAGRDYLASVIVVVALAALGWAINPRLVAVGWIPVAWAVVVAMLGETLQLPSWARDLSVFQRIGQVPVDHADGTAISVLLVLTVLMSVVASIRFRSRSLSNG